MFTRMIHCLTLVAFAAHVSLGCCMHHQHADAFEMCAHHHCDGEAVESHDHDHEHKHVVPESDGNVDAEESSPIPCDHSPQCDQGRCTFVASKPQADNFTDSGVYLQLALSFYAVVEPTFIENRIDRLLRIDWPSTGLRCALQQSWQI